MSAVLWYWVGIAKVCWRGLVLLGVLKVGRMWCRVLRLGAVRPFCSRVRVRSGAVWARGCMRRFRCFGKRLTGCVGYWMGWSSSTASRAG